MKRVRKPFSLRPFAGSVPESAGICPRKSVPEKSAVSIRSEERNLLEKRAIRGVCPRKAQTFRHEAKLLVVGEKCRYRIRLTWYLP